MTNDNADNQIPRVIKGTGFYTPMDLVPTEIPAGEGGAQTPASSSEMVSQPASSDIPTPPIATSQPAQPPQSQGNDNVKNS